MSVGIAGGLGECRKFPSSKITSTCMSLSRQAKALPMRNCSDFEMPFTSTKSWWCLWWTEIFWQSANSWHFPVLASAWLLMWQLTSFSPGHVGRWGMQSLRILHRKFNRWRIALSVSVWSAPFKFNTSCPMVLAFRWWSVNEVHD